MPSEMPCISSLAALALKIPIPQLPFFELQGSNSFQGSTPLLKDPAVSLRIRVPYTATQAGARILISPPNLSFQPLDTGPP